jgi:hypothetical protein
MLRALLSTVVVAGCFLPSMVSAQELPDRIIKYFSGKWTVIGPEQGQTSTANWKTVAGGRATAGDGTNSKTGAHFGLGRWQAEDKTWVHDWAEEKGGYGHLESTRFEKDTYYGKVRAVDEAGKPLAGEARVKIIDPDHFEYTVTAGDSKLMSRWSRQK